MSASTARQEMLGSLELWDGDSVSTSSANQMESFDASSRRVSGFPCFRGPCQRHSINVIPHVEVGDAPPWCVVSSPTAVSKRNSRRLQNIRHATLITNLLSACMAHHPQIYVSRRPSLTQLGIEPAGPMGRIIDFGDHGYFGDVMRPGRHRMTRLLI